MVAPQTRILIEAASLNKEYIYGVDRYMVRSYESWRDFLETPKLQHENKSWVHTNTFSTGTRVLDKEGYLPIGFFQLWNPSISKVDKYNEGHTDAGREDSLFAQKWSRSKRHMLPELIGYHLESEGGMMGVNWNGRKTKPFRRSL